MILTKIDWENRDSALFFNKAIEHVLSRITMSEGNMDWLTRTLFLTKERGFLLKMRRS